MHEISQDCLTSKTAVYILFIYFKVNFLTISLPFFPFLFQASAITLNYQ